MKVGIVGLGRMGFAVASRLHTAGWDVEGYDIDAHNSSKAIHAGIKVHNSLEHLASSVELLWLMVPAGELIDTIVQKVVSLLIPGSIIVDGGNSHFKDTMRRAAYVKKSGHSFVDCGTSGGVHGLKNGFCLMVGADNDAYVRIEPFLKSVATVNGYAHMGPVGAGHFVKMVHNGIEYGIMQAYGEGYALLHKARIEGHPFDLEKISTVWQNGSVIRSWLLELVHTIFTQHGQELNEISGKVASSGMGQWTVETAQEMDVAVPVIEKALTVRADSLRTGGDYGTKVVALMRTQFGGHSFVKKDEE